MSSRYKLDRATDGTYSIIDIFTGWTAVYLGRELSRIPADMAEAGLQTLNALDHAERSWCHTEAQTTALRLQA